MVVLFVHGLWRTPRSSWRLLRHLRRAGCKTRTFSYAAISENFDAIVARLGTAFSSFEATEEYIVVAHSLGGVMVRSALNSLPPGSPLPRHVYLLGSPVLASRIATRLKDNFMFRFLAGDCGQLLASSDRMKTIAPLTVPTTGVVGVRGISGRYSPFGSDANDGMVSVAEVIAPWLTNCVYVPVFHTLLPSSARVVNIILQDMARHVR